MISKIYRINRDKNTCRLFCTDLDGTLLNDDGSISNENIGAIKKLSLQTPIVLASGRAPVAMEEIAKLLIGRPNKWYLISHNGALVVDEEGLPLYQKRIGRGDATALLDKLKTLREQELYDSNLLVNYFVGSHLFSVKDDKVEDLRAGYLQRNGNRLDYILLPDIENLKGLEAPHKILVIAREKPGTIVKNFRQAIYGTPGLSEDLVVKPSQPNYFEFTHADATKGKALEGLARRLGIYPRNVAYAGNDFNDKDALLLVGYPIIVGNAPKTLVRELEIELAGRLIHVKADNNQNGVAHAIKRLPAKRAYKPI